MYEADGPLHGVCEALSYEACKRRASNDHVGFDLLIDGTRQSIDPGRSVCIAQRDAMGHLLNVRCWMEVVPFQVRPCEVRRGMHTDGALTRARHSHEHEGSH